MYTLSQLGWTDELQTQFDAICATHNEPLLPARISADYGIQYEIFSPQGTLRAKVGGLQRIDRNNPETTTAVGDWVCVRILEDNLAQIVETLPRRSQLVRQAAGKRTAMQIIAANLDIVFIVTSLNLELNLRRLERYMTAVFDGGATPVLILTKVDLVDDPTPFQNEVDSIAANTPIVLTNALNGFGIDKIKALIPPGTTAAFVGSSGVGKSTLTNALMGNQIQAVAETRASDNRGRHTTTHRQMLILPDGGIVIDTPGMREFHLWDSLEGLANAFDDIHKLAADCAFRDCMHDAEPGCAVQAAVATQTLDPDRLTSFHKLAREAALQSNRKDAATALTLKQDNKRLPKSTRKDKKRK